VPTPKDEFGEWHTPETHAITHSRWMPLWGAARVFGLLGTDYDTRDGSCVRDFVHVLDLADAHTAPLEHLLNSGASHGLDLGTGTGRR